MPTRRASRGWTSLTRMNTPRLTFRMSPASTASRLQSAKSAHRPCRYRSFGFHLQAKTASRTPGEERALRTIQNALRRERPPYACACESDSSECPVRDPSKNLHTVSSSLVPSCASTPPTTSLGLDDRALTRPPRCVRPTSANHSFFLNLYPRSRLPTLLGPPHRSGRCDRRVRRFTTRWTRFDGPCGNEDGCWPSRAWG